MNPRTHIFPLVLALAAFSGCSSEQADSKKARITPDRIQGKAQVLTDATGATETAMSAGGPAVYIWEGMRRYRLFLNTPAELVHGDEYIAEGIHAQKVIDEIGDPDQGKNGYPLQSSCERVVRMAWSGLPFDVTDGRVSVLRASVKRYPARPVFLVTKLQAVAPKEGDTAPAKPKNAATDAKNIPEVAVAADKQRALLIEGPTVHPAPLWEPKGATVRCKVIIDETGKISDLESGTQLCEAVPWAQFRYQPPVQRSRPVKVSTEVEIRFEPRT
jgi:hypothetical protein